MTNFRATAKLDGDDLSGDDAELVRRPALVQGEEEHAEAKAERHDGADHRVAVPGAGAEQADRHTAIRELRTRSSSSP